MNVNPIEDSGDGLADEFHDGFQSGVLMEGCVADKPRGIENHSKRWVLDDLKSSTVTVRGVHRCNRRVYQGGSNLQFVECDLSSEIQPASLIGHDVEDPHMSLDSIMRQRYLTLEC